MKIALVTETFPPEVNGVAMTLKRLVEGVARLGCDITVVRPRQKSDAPITHPPGANGNGTHSGPLYRECLMPGVALPKYDGLMMGLPVLGRLAKIWTRDRPDVVHIATEGPLGWSALGAALKLNIPISSSFHTNFHQYGAHYGYGALIEVAVGYLKSFHNQTAVTMVPTRQMRAELAAEGFRNIEVVSRGVDPVLFSPARRSQELRRSWGAAPADHVYLYVGRLAPEKNIELAVASYLEVRARDPRAHFVLVGDGPERASLQRKHPDFHFAGMRRGDDLAAHYASGDVFLFPSVTETFGNVVTEALGSGLVVVSYDYAAGREYIVPWQNGVLAAFKDTDGFRAATLETAQRAAEWPRLRAAARETALGVTWDAIITRFRDTLATVSLQRASGRSV